MIKLNFREYYYNSRAYRTAACIPKGAHIAYPGDGSATVCGLIFTADIKPQVGDYIGRLINGEMYHAPKSSFEPVNIRIDAELDPVDRRLHCVTLGVATEQAEMGYRISRKGWSAMDMYVIFVPTSPDGFLVDDNAAKIYKLAPGSRVIMNPYFIIRNSNGSWSTWSPSCEDATAKDWYVHSI